LIDSRYGDPPPSAGPVFLTFTPPGPAASVSPPVPVPARPLAGRREKATIRKPNDFQQPGERYRSWDADRQERFVRRFADQLGHPKVSQELRSIWIDLLSKCDASLGRKIATRLNVKPSM
jgi:catalase